MKRAGTKLSAIPRLLGATTLLGSLALAPACQCKANKVVVSKAEVSAPAQIDPAAQEALAADYDRCRDSARRASQIFDEKVRRFGGVNKAAADAAFVEIRKLPGVLDAGVDKTPDDWFWLKLTAYGSRLYYLRVPRGAEYVTTGSLEDKRIDEIECDKAVAYALMTYREYLKGHSDQLNAATMSVELLAQLKKIPMIVESSISYSGGEISIKLTCGYAATIKP